MTTEMEVISCSFCDGHGDVYVGPPYMKELHYLKTKQCPFCNGTGWVVL